MNGETIIEHTKIETDAGTFIVEEDNEGWDTRYRLRFEDRVTVWGSYENLFYIGDHVAVSPYYHGKGKWVICTPLEALEYAGRGES